MADQQMDEEFSVTTAVYSSVYTSSHVFNVSSFGWTRRVAFTASTVHHPLMISLYQTSLIKKLPVGQDF